MIAWFLDEKGDVSSRPTTIEELASARKAVREKLSSNPTDFASRTCWVCNPMHDHFLENINDGFTLSCFDCGHLYYQGIDVTEDPAQ